MNKQKENPVYLITGVMAAGKSTVAELLAMKFPKSVHLRGDIFRKMIISGREDITANPTIEALNQLKLRYKLSAEAAETYQKAGFTVVWQDVMIGKILSDVITFIRSRPLYVIILYPSPEVVARREIARSKTGYGGGFTPDNFYKILMDETPHIGLWLDSSGQTPEETVAEILSRTQAGEGLLMS